MKFYWEKLKDIRKGTRISINYIVNRMNISRSTYWLWETGDRCPGEEKIKMLARIFNVPVSAISDLEESIEISRLTSHEIATSIIEPILLNTENIKNAYEGIINIAIQLKRKSEQSASLLKALLNSNKVMFYVKDTNLNYLAVNEIFLKTLSMPADFNYAGKDDSAFFSVDEARRNTEEDKHVLASNTSIENREDFIPGTRKKSMGLISKYPIFDSDGKVIGIAATFIDITKRVISENKSILLGEVLENLPIGISISSTGSELLKGAFYANSSFKSFGIPDRNTILNHHESIRGMISPKDTGEFLRFIGSDKLPGTVSVRLKSDSVKKPRWIKYSIFQIDKFVISMVEDISEEKEQEEVYELLKIHMNTSDKAISIINLDVGRYEYVNRQKGSIYGREQEEFYSHDPDFWVNECVHPEDRKYVKGLLRKNQGTGKQYAVREIRIIRPDGEIRCARCETSYGKFRDSDCVINVETDITGEKKNDEIKELLKIYMEAFNKSIMIYDFDSEKYLYINEAAEKLYGRKAAEFYKGGGNFWLNRCVHPADRKRMGEYKSGNADLLDYYRKNKVLQYRIVRPDGEVRLLSVDNTFITFKGNNCTMFVATDLSDNDNIK